MSDPLAPKFDDAPGIVIRRRESGQYVAYWQARSDKVKAGFRPHTSPLWRGIEPSRIDRQYVAEQCRRLQNEMLAYGTTDIPMLGAFNGTVESLIACYKADPDSTYQAVRYRTREHYDNLMKRIKADLGEKRIEEIDARLMKHTHRGWAEGGKVAMSHALVGMFRSLITYGATLQKSKECRELKVDLGDMKFPMAKPRDERLTAEHATAIRAKAHEMRIPEVALAQALQFECMLRQKDVIGEWVPNNERGMSDVSYAGYKWLMGIRWSEVDDNLILRHVTSKRGKPVTVDLKIAPMVMEELKAIYGYELGLSRDALPRTGPIIVHSDTRRPFITHQWRRVWRKVADFAGVPKNVRNMDSRAGAISEATDAGADIESVRHAATHSTIHMTSRYSRGAEEKTAAVLQKRVAFRKNKSEQ